MAEPSTTVTLAVGDRVVYPNQGVHRVSAIDVKEVAGQRLTFVSLLREEDGALVMVPEGKVSSIGVRKVAGPAEAQELFDFLRSDSDRVVLDWKQRARTNVERMTTGGLMGLGEVVKGLAVLSELRPLPTKERELYDNARKLLVAELSAALEIEGCNAEDAVDLILFPPGRERPKRTSDEFRAQSDDDDLDLDADLLGLDGELGLPDDDEPQEEEDEGEESPEAADEDADEDEAPKKKPAAKKASAPKKTAEKKATRVELSDDEVTQPMGTALVPDGVLPPKRKRGRPPKNAEVSAAAAAETAEPKKRGRPPKAKTGAEGEAPAEPKKRGRPPKAKAEAEGAEPAAPKKRGRPPKAKTES